MPAATYFDNFLKNNYSTEERVRLVNEDHLHLDLISKSTGTGLQYVDVLIDKNASGVAATIANAQTISGATYLSNVAGAQWIVKWGEYDGSVVIPDKVMAQSASDLGAFFEAKKEEIDSLYRAFGDALEQYALRDSGHAIGAGTLTATGTITFTNKSDANNFERGMQIQSSQGDGTSTGHSLLGSGSIGYVYSVNTNTGVVLVATSNANANAKTAGSPTSWDTTPTVNYYFRLGDFGGTSTPNVIMDGFGSYVPATDPTDTFNNVDRSVDPVARGGVRLTAAECAGLNTEQRVKKLLARMASTRSCIKAGKVVEVHPIVWQNLAEIMEARGQRPLEGKVGTANFSKLQVATAAGMVEAMPNKYMPLDAIYVVNSDYIRIKHLDGFPKILNGDGLQMLRSATANTYEHRIVAYPLQIVRAPGSQGRCPANVTF